VMYEGCDYNIALDTKRNHGGTCFQMFTWGPEFVSWPDSPGWLENLLELEGKVQDAANKANALHTLGRVNAGPEVTYGVDIRLQSPEQFKDFFYKAACALKAVEQDFMDELRNIGLNFWKLSSEPCEIGERIIGELCTKQGFISGSDGKSCLKALGNNNTLKVEYCVYEEGFTTHISHYHTGISRVPETEPGCMETIRFYRGEFPADEVMDRVKEAVAFTEAHFVEAAAAGNNFEAADEQEKAGGL
ncbi:MAG: hypothetical protein LBL56_01805, partial [Treponema sp.]|nr:hypothetical protein [Treponema sp.]